MDQAKLWHTISTDCNRFIYEHQYPNGGLVYASLQHRDLVQVYVAGAMDTVLTILDNFGNPSDLRKVAMQVMNNHVLELTNPNWTPGLDFRPPANYLSRGEK